MLVCLSDGALTLSKFFPKCQKNSHYIHFWAYSYWAIAIAISHFLWWRKTLVFNVNLLFYVQFTNLQIESFSAKLALQIQKGTTFSVIPTLNKICFVTFISMSPTRLKGIVETKKSYIIPRNWILWICMA